jgi:hypothetical protein
MRLFLNPPLSSIATVGMELQIASSGEERRCCCWRGNVSRGTFDFQARIRRSVLLAAGAKLSLILIRSHRRIRATLRDTRDTRDTLKHQLTKSCSQPNSIGHSNSRRELFSITCVMSILPIVKMQHQFTRKRNTKIMRWARLPGSRGWPSSPKFANVTTP